MRCMDIGSSTGGFSDCLLQAGAGSVACVDVNYGQLAWKLRQDPRVAVFERTNIKLADPVELGAPFDLLVADLSFIGLAALAPTFARFAQAGTIFIGLIKPQFESQHDETDHGIVRDERSTRYERPWKPPASSARASPKAPSPATRATWSTWSARFFRGSNPSTRGTRRCP